jgi:hypothetical protein
MSYQFKRCPDSCLNDMAVGNRIDLFGNVQNKYGILKLFQGSVASRLFCLFVFIIIIRLVELCLINKKYAESTQNLFRNKFKITDFIVL